MIDYRNLVAEHYSKGKLFDLIINAFKKSGIEPNQLTLEDLKKVDEFHIGGLEATIGLLDNLKINSATKVIDIGSGIGGAARHINSYYGADVTGIDLTSDFVEAAIQLSKLVDLNINFKEADALDIPFNDNNFDLATLLHVGMNLADKKRLFSEVARILTSGGFFAIYDVMIVGEGNLLFPVPWASDAKSSFVESPEIYRTAANNAGFELKVERERVAFALAFFKNLKKTIDSFGPPLVGLNLVMGNNAQIKIGNLVKAIEEGYLAPVEMIFKKL